MNSFRFLILPIDGMTCASCASRVKKSLSEIDGITEVDVNLAAEQASLAYSNKSSPDFEELDSILRKGGYSLRFRKTDIVIPGLNDPTIIDKIKKRLSAVFGIKNVLINTATETLSFDYISGVTPVRKVELILQEETNENIIWRELNVDKDKEYERSLNKRIRQQQFFALFSIAGALIVFVLTMPIFFPFILKIPLSARYILASSITAVILFIFGKEIFRGFFNKLAPGKSDMNTLVGLGSGTAFFYSLVVTILLLLNYQPVIDLPVFFDSAAFIVGFILLGRSLETRARKRTGDSLAELAKLQPDKATVERDGKIQTIAVEYLQENDICLVNNGENIPADGILISETAEIDEALLSGENLPVSKKKGSMLIAGSVNKNAQLRFRILKTGSDTALGQIINWVKQAQNSQPPIQKLVDKVAAVFVPIVFIIAIVTFLIWIFFEGSLELSILHFINVIVIACPCALGLATPTAIVVSMGKCAKDGLLIKNAEVLEKVNNINQVLFDKTGTITTGKLLLEKIKSQVDEDELLAAASALETGSTHPIANAILNFAKDKNITVPEIANVQIIAGYGVSGSISGSSWLIGNRAMMDSFKVELGSQFKEAALKFNDQGITTVFVAQDKKCVGLLGFADQLRNDIESLLQFLKKEDIETAIVSGDAQKTVNYVANQLGIKRVFAEQPPQVKSKVVKSLQENSKKVAMLGDGINDAIALTQADVGIAFGEGADIATAAADVVFIKPKMALLTKLLETARKTRKIIWQNLFWAFGYNLVMLPSAAGILFLLWGYTFKPVFAAMAMALSSISVVSNSLRLNKR